ncbi:MAG: putative DNA binding domain-containing protein [Desulfamplus sp.]|nr:putative DNA binding domain-containing protein [Desulfamplus sp.]
MIDHLNMVEKIQMGEDSHTQFKENVFEPKSFAEEMVAFSNADGGDIVIGVSNSGEIMGLVADDVRRLNQLISNVANENVRPPVYPLVDLLDIKGKILLIVRIRKGVSKPYCTSGGLYVTKSGSDKRKMSPDELRRLFAESGNAFADETTISGSDIKDINIESFYNFLERKDKGTYIDLKSNRLDFVTILSNLDLLRDGQLTLAGNLLFGMNPQRFCKSFYVQCVHFAGNDIDVNQFITKENITGTLYEMYKQCLNFIKSNLSRVQDDANFNTSGSLEIPEETLIEVIINALIHRDYYIQSTVKVFIFTDRVEIINPGRLPNSLTVEKIKNGISIHRNPILNSLGQYIMPYSGLGSGIRRIIRYSPDTVFVNDVNKEQFKCVLRRTI